MPQRILSRQINKEHQNLRMGYLELGRSKLSKHFLLLLVQSLVFAKEGKIRSLGSKILYSLSLHIKHMYDKQCFKRQIFFTDIPVKSKNI